MSNVPMSAQFSGDANGKYRLRMTKKVGNRIEEVDVRKPSAEEEEDMILAGLEEVPGGGGTGFARFLSQAAHRTSNPNFGVTGGFIDENGVPHTGSEFAQRQQEGKTGFAQFVQREALNAGGHDEEDRSAPAHGFGVSEGIDPTRGPERRREPANDGGSLLTSAERELYPHEPEELNRNPFGKGQSGESVSTADMSKEEIIRKPLPEQVRGEGEGNDLVSRAERRRMRRADGPLPNWQSEPVDDTDVRERNRLPVVEDPTGRDVPGREEDKATQIPPQKFDDEGSWQTPGFSQGYPQQRVKDTEIMARQVTRVRLTDGRVLIGRIASSDGFNIDFVGRMAGDRSDANYSFPVTDIAERGPYRLRAERRSPETLDDAYAAFRRVGSRAPFARKSVRTAATDPNGNVINVGDAVIVMGYSQEEEDAIEGVVESIDDRGMIQVRNSEGNVVSSNETSVFKKEALNNVIPGGLAATKDGEDFDPDAVLEGKGVEREHTDDPDVAREIAEDHLTEDPDYYKKLKTIESRRLAGEGTPGFDMMDADTIQILKSVSERNDGGIDSMELNELVEQGLLDYSPGVESTFEPGHYFLTEQGEATLNKAASRRKNMRTASEPMSSAITDDDGDPLPSITPGQPRTCDKCGNMYVPATPEGGPIDEDDYLCDECYKQKMEARGLHMGSNGNRTGSLRKTASVSVGDEVEITEGFAYPGGSGVSPKGKRGTVTDISPNSEGGTDIATVEFDGQEGRFYVDSLKKTAAVAAPDRNAGEDKSIGDGQLYGDDAALRDQLKIRDKRKKAMKARLDQLIRTADALDKGGKHAEAKAYDARIESMYADWKREGQAVSGLQKLLYRKALKRMASSEAKPRVFFENSAKADPDASNPFHNPIL